MSAGRSNTFHKSDWLTPKEYINTINSFWGSIELDPCGNKHSLVKAIRQYNLPSDGLKLPWDAPTIYVNPPYGRQPNGTRIIHWLQRCVEANNTGSEVIALVPVAPNTKHWKTCIFGYAKYICFLSEPRVKFHYPNINSKGASMACCLVYWGQNPQFITHFKKHGYIISLDISQ